MEGGWTGVLRGSGPRCQRLDVCRGGAKSDHDGGLVGGDREPESGVGGLGRIAAKDLGQGEGGGGARSDCGRGI
ncbi:hypothetical protein TIFTF001_029444 [Ficus carica]|uniref:Uncharacterized protein n=1 Tax=Ficus carica TaxID=3494 RepID=A0AA88DRT0_FICCA|nr:hypothetical protein TIFTF001_045663 [Ficus carica]GMN60339.1 hypothetical protein TIFTF001_029444 [Ficus carica]